ncbi:MAG: ABC transporter permease [Bifidobacteriaceae bacterium]|jgi:putative ABC transport system permease protein|nr:ABC transporter permease [Bifidobacteriaceae bacterium]
MRRPLRWLNVILALAAAAAIFTICWVSFRPSAGADTDTATRRTTPVALGTVSRTISADAEDARQVCALGADLAYDIFGPSDPVGAELIVGGVPFTVHGVMKSKDTAGGSSANSSLIAPLSRVQRSLTGYGTLSSITLQATSSTAASAAASEATAVIAGALGIAPADATFRVTTQAPLLEASAGAAAMKPVDALRHE